MIPADLLNTWIKEETLVGAKYAQHATLSTQGLDGHPHSRVVHIREITPEHILLFTQKGTRKVDEIKNNSKVSLSFWLERNTRSVTVEGEAIFLSSAKNEYYWNSYPVNAQIRFYSYAPTSSQPIENKQILENKKLEIEQSYKNEPLPLSPYYLGISIKPTRYVFYTYRTDELSDVLEYQVDENGNIIEQSILSP